MKGKDEIYLQVFHLEDKKERCVAPIETAISLVTLKYCQSDIRVKFVKTEMEPEIDGYTLRIGDIPYEDLSTKDDRAYYTSSCDLPNILIVNDEETVVAGLCATLRQIVKNTISKDPKHYCRRLLGFKDSCLLAPSETSVWTRYCEIDLSSTLKKLKRHVITSGELPKSMARFEAHMREPVRLHNVYKYTMSKKFALNGIASNDERIVPEHLYAEGSFLTLADIIIFVCFHISFKLMPSSGMDELLPLTSKWYERIIAAESLVLRCLDSLVIIDKWSEIAATRYSLPIVRDKSLYKSDPKRYKPRDRVYTRQEDVESSLRIIDRSMIIPRLDEQPYGFDVSLDWREIPHEATPEGGKLPLQRLQRKYQQLENLCKPVLRLAKTNDVIVDFCSGSGHLGILVAHLLPQCTVLLLEIKEESLNRSKERVKKMHLKNVKFYQCNLDYFKGHFDIGMSLHACGVATDLVLQHCIRRKAVFVSCPCCYGSVHDCHRVTYPRSEIFRTIIDERGYMILGHSADQTHDVENAKTAQGNRCMAIIDTDRKLQAEQHGYVVYLAKLVPETCTPKNHLLVGIPKDRAPYRSKETI